MTINQLQTIFARNCYIQRTTKQYADSFLNTNHNLGGCKGRYFYGLYLNKSTSSTETALEKDTLVALAVFSNARTWQKGEKSIRSYEWIRYASLDGFRVVGAMSKFLKHFINEVSPDDIMTYVDSSSENAGESYLKLGFIQEGIVHKENFSNLKFRLKLTEY